MTLFYSEKRNALGKWQPQVTAQRPSEKKAEGAQVKLRSIQEVAPEHMDQSIGQLEKSYGTM